jgi:demethylmenaquinone methyltransferase/2-methoxy-6-polyprenyl-1,4-benzoquinol methylase
MANPYYQAGKQRAARVRDLFGRVARRYDLINDLQSFGLHRLWKRRVVRLAAAGGGSALDICCGTGDIALGLAWSAMRVTGLDFSPEMLAVAEERRNSAESPGRARTPLRAGQVRFLQGDAQELPFPDASFDAVTVGYGLRNLSSWEQGLAEMARVARPGGKLVVLDFGKPDNAVWRGLYFGYLRLFVPLLGLVFCGDPAAYSYILESLKHYPAQRGVENRMQAMGLINVRTYNLLRGVMSINYGEKTGG